MFKKNDCVPGGGFVQLIAGDSPSPVATPGAAWVNLTRMSPPSGKPATVNVIAGAAGAPPRCPPGCCAAIGANASRVIIERRNLPVGFIRILLRGVMIASRRAGCNVVAWRAAVVTTYDVVLCRSR